MSLPASIINGHSNIFGDSFDDRSLNSVPVGKKAEEIKSKRNLSAFLNNNDDLSPSLIDNQSDTLKLEDNDDDTPRNGSEFLGSGERSDAKEEENGVHINHPDPDNMVNQQMKNRHRELTNTVSSPISIIESSPSFIEPCDQKSDRQVATPVIKLIRKPTEHSDDKDTTLTDVLREKDEEIKRLSEIVKSMKDKKKKKNKKDKKSSSGSNSSSDSSSSSSSSSDDDNKDKKRKEKKHKKKNKDKDKSGDNKSDEKESDENKKPKKTDHKKKKGKKDKHKKMEKIVIETQNSNDMQSPKSPNEIPQEIQYERVDNEKQSRLIQYESFSAEVNSPITDFRQKIDELEAEVKKLRQANVDSILSLQNLQETIPKKKHVNNDYMIDKLIVDHNLLKEELEQLKWQHNNMAQSSVLLSEIGHLKKDIEHLKSQNEKLKRYTQTSPVNVTPKSRSRENINTIGNSTSDYLVQHIHGYRKENNPTTQPPHVSTMIRSNIDSYESPYATTCQTLQKNKSKPSPPVQRTPVVRSRRSSDSSSVLIEDTTPKQWNPSSQTAAKTAKFASDHHVISNLPPALQPRSKTGKIGPNAKSPYYSGLYSNNSQVNIDDMEYNYFGNVDQNYPEEQMTYRSTESQSYVTVTTEISTDRNDDQDDTTLGFADDYDDDDGGGNDANGRKKVPSASSRSYNNKFLDVADQYDRLANSGAYNYRSGQAINSAKYPVTAGDYKSQYHSANASMRSADRCDDLLSTVYSESTLIDEGEDKAAFSRRPHQLGKAFTPKTPSDLSLEDTVKFARPGGKMSSGRVCFIGHLPGRHEICVGIELDEDTGAAGKHDGLFEGMRYFQCRKNRGVFISFHKIILAYKSI